MLQLILARHLKDDYYKTTKEKLMRVQENYLYFVNTTSLANHNSFIARYIRSVQLFVIDDEIPFDQQINYAKTHSPTNVNFY